MRATLDSLGADERTVHVADSFQGFPAADGVSDLNEIDFLAVPEQEVRDSFGRFGLDRGVRIVPGFFEETLPALGGNRWALVRLDGDTYDATRTALEALYPDLAVGGYLIVDDYGVMERAGVSPRRRRVPRATTASPNRSSRSTGPVCAGDATRRCPDRGGARAALRARACGDAAARRRPRADRPRAGARATRSRRCASG